jgi:nickel-dependent lactate racemase
MRVGVDWGRQHLELDVAAENVVAAQRAALNPPLADPAAVLRQALDEPFDFPPLRRALTPDDHVVVFVDEHVPQLPRLLVPILEHIRSAGVAAEAITLLCLPPSTGQPWLDDLPDEFEDVRIELHQPNDRRKISYLAATKKGKRIYLNRSAVDADQLVLLTRRSYDPILGYAGAEAALYPGLSDEATHQEYANQFHIEAPGSKPWPVLHDAAEVAWLVGAPFLVQVIEGSGADVAHVVAGTMQSGAEGQRLLDMRWRVAVDRPADLVVAGISGDPARLSTDDLARAFFAAARVVKPGGRIVVLNEAVPALGPSFELLRQQEDIGAALKLLLKEQPIDLHAGFMWASAARDARLYLLSGLPTEVAEELFTTPLEKASEVQRLLGANADVLFLPDAHKTLAVVES